MLAVDSNPDALRTYEMLFPDLKHARGEIVDVLDSPLGAQPSAAERRLARAIGRIDVLLGGPPCQGHSNLNNHTRRRDPKNKLYDRIARFAELVRPRHLIVENVPSVLHDRGDIVEVVAGALRAIGYSVDQGIVHVDDLGVAQLRRRHVLVASLPRVPELKTMGEGYRRPRRTVSWAIRDLRSAGNSPIDTPARSSNSTRRRITYLFDTGRYDLPDRLRPDCHRYVSHSYRSIYGRLDWRKPAQTITTGFTCMGQGRYVHPGQPRTLTPHEAARLQFIPDFVRFPTNVGRKALAEMIGNAVPPKLTYVLALELLR